MLGYGSILALTLLLLGKFPYEIMTGKSIKAAFADNLATDMNSVFAKPTNMDAMNENMTEDLNEAVDITTSIYIDTDTEDGLRKRRYLTTRDIVEKIIASSLNATKERVKRGTPDPIKLVINDKNVVNTENASVFFSKVFEMAEKMYKSLKLNDTVKVKDKATYFKTIFEDPSGNITGPTVEIGIYEKVNSSDKKAGEGNGYFKPIIENFALATEAIDDSNRSRSKRIL